MFIPVEKSLRPSRDRAKNLSARNISPSETSPPEEVAISDLVKNYNNGQGHFEVGPAPASSSINETGLRRVAQGWQGRTERT